MPDSGHANPAKNLTAEWVDRNALAITELNDALFYFGEPSLEEHESAALLTSILEEAGFAVERGISGFPTAFIATYGRGEPVIALHAEYDATPGSSQQGNVAKPLPIVAGAPGHAEGHQANATVMTAAALGVKRAMQERQIKGTLKVFGAPGEEILISRPFFVRDGYFDDVDVAFHNHIRDAFYTEVGQTQISLISVEFAFTGESAHAGLTPWQGRDALDAVVLMDTGMAHYREHMKPGMRAHRVITNGGEQPNVIPSHAAIWWFLRGYSAADTKSLMQRAIAIAEGAALMTNTEVAIETKSAVWPTRCNRTLADLLDNNMRAVGMPAWSESEIAFAKSVQSNAGVRVEGLRKEISPMRGPVDPEMSSNDCGDISWKVPMGRLWFPGSIPNIHFHHWSGGTMLTTSIAHKAILAASKVLAASVVDCLTRPALVDEVRRTFAQEIGEARYEPLIPLDQAPRLGLHTKLMEHYRPLMREHYRQGRPQFKP